MKIRIPNTINSCIVFVCYVCLFFSITNIIPVSVGYVVLVVTIPYLFFTHRHYNSLQICLFILYVYFVLSTALYDPKALISPGFYRRDGNFFITFLPLLLLPDSEIQFSVEKVAEWFIYVTTIADVVCLFFHYTEVYPLGIMRTDPAHTYHFLFESHNAAGGFLGIVLALTIGYVFYGSKEKRFIYSVCMIVNFVGTWATNSRGSILAILLSVVFIGLSRVVIRGKKGAFHFDELFFLLLLGVVIAFEYFVYHMWGDNAYGGEFHALLQEKLFGKFGFAQDRTWTIFDRILRLWPHAIKMFLASPIVGCGFGSFNDEYAVNSYVNHIFAWNNPEVYQYNDSHAHQSFLNILGETGILGLGLVIAVLYFMKKSILQLKNKALSFGLYIGLVINVVTSFTEHRLFTPSQMVPFLLILAMCLSRREDSYNGDVQRERKGK